MRAITPYTGGAKSAELVLWHAHEDQVRPHVVFYGESLIVAARQSAVFADMRCAFELVVPEEWVVALGMGAPLKQLPDLLKKSLRLKSEGVKDAMRLYLALEQQYNTRLTEGPAADAEIEPAQLRAARLRANDRKREFELAEKAAAAEVARLRAWEVLLAEKARSALATAQAEGLDLIIAPNESGFRGVYKEFGRCVALSPPHPPPL